MYRLPDTPRPLAFPDDFTTTPEGLLALGGNLHPATLVNAYAKGIFPWFNAGDPILWWHPDPRAVLFPERVHVSASMRKFLRKGLFSVTFNRDFARVIGECAAKRGKGRRGTWIVPEMIQSYIALHERGFAQSVEVRDASENLVGGMYGVTLGGVFFGESMFSHRDNASKTALIGLCERMRATGYVLMDCQVESAHLNSLGAERLSRREFLERLERAGCSAGRPGPRL